MQFILKSCVCVFLIISCTVDGGGVLRLFKNRRPAPVPLRAIQMREIVRPNLRRTQSLSTLSQSSMSRNRPLLPISFSEPQPPPPPPPPHTQNNALLPMSLSSITRMLPPANFVRTRLVPNFKGDLLQMTKDGLKNTAIGLAGVGGAIQFAGLLESVSTVTTTEATTTTAAAAAAATHSTTMSASFTPKILSAENPETTRLMPVTTERMFKNKIGVSTADKVFCKYHLLFRFFA